jgi:hypothetical protein
MEKTSRLTSSLIVVAALMLSSAVLQGAEREFDEIVRAISDQFHTRPVHIPFLGFVNFAMRPAGVKHAGLAVFEDLDLDDGAAFAVAKTIRATDDRWSQFVRVQDRATTVLVFMEQERSDCKLLVAAIERGEITVVELKLNPAALQVWFREPDSSAVRGVSR